MWEEQEVPPQREIIATLEGRAKRFNTIIIDSEACPDYAQLGDLRYVTTPNHVILLRVRAEEVAKLLDLSGSHYRMSVLSYSVDSGWCWMRAQHGSGLDFAI